MTRSLCVRVVVLMGATLGGACQHAPAAPSASSAQSSAVAGNIDVAQAVTFQGKSGSTYVLAINVPYRDLYAGSDAYAQAGSCMVDNVTHPYQLGGSLSSDGTSVFFAFVPPSPDSCPGCGIALSIAGSGASGTILAGQTCIIGTNTELSGIFASRHIWISAAPGPASLAVPAAASGC